MKEDIPQFLRDELLRQYGEVDAERIAQGYAARRATTLRVNRLKAGPQAVREALKEAGM